MGSGPGYHEPVYQAPEPVYQPPEPVYHAPEPVYHAPEPVYQAPEPVYHAPEPVYIPEVKPVYKPTPKPFHYSQPNYRPPIQSKPIIDSHHAIVSVPHRQPEVHYEPPHHHHEVHSIDDDHHPNEYLHPVQHTKDKKGELDFYKKYANRHEGSKSLNFKAPLKFRFPGTRAGGARFLHLPGGAPGSTFSSQEIAFGGETGSYGAFRWFSDHPVIFYY